VPFRQINVEIPGGVHQIDVFECDVAIKQCVLDQSTALGQCLPVVSRSLDVVPLVDLHSLVEDVSDDHEVYLPP
jgi:hypothetical protein